MSLVTELERLADALGDTSAEVPPISLGACVAERIAKNLNVKTEEVAILGLSSKWRHLHFLVPGAAEKCRLYSADQQFRACGAHRARKSSRNQQCFRSRASRHRFRRRENPAADSGEAIQKIISAPILNGDKVIGVIQISRKGANTSSAGADFTASRPRQSSRALQTARKASATSRQRLIHSLHSHFDALATQSVFRNPRLNALTLQNLLVTFPQRKIFSQSNHGGTHTGTMAFVAKKIFLTKGVGKHRERLSSFELALRNAGIAACNIVRVSSIFPPNCKLISRSEGLKHIKPGQVAFTVISENSTKEAHRLIAASIGLALPSDKSMYGYLSEHHSFGETEEVAGEYAEELAAEMLATTLNVEFDPDLSFDEKKEVYRISNKIVRTMNVTQSAVGDKRGLWTTVLGAAILIGEDD